MEVRSNGITTEQQLAIAEQISSLLNNPGLPEPIKDALAEGLVETYNSHIDQSEFAEYQKSTEYIQTLLRGYETKNS